MSVSASASAEDKYASVYQLVNIPKKRKLNPANQNIIHKSEPLESQQEFIDPELTRNRDNLIQNLQNNFQIYQKDYEFKFPSSKFPDIAEGQSNLISYRLRDQQAILPAQQRISDLQLQQIREKGQFQVRVGSNKNSIPYVWKINDCLLKGRVNRVNIWEQGLAWCYTLLRNAADNLVEVGSKGFFRIIKTPVKLFSLFFGKKLLRTTYTTNSQRQLFKQFWHDVLSYELKDLKNQIGHQFLDGLYIKYEPQIFFNQKRNEQKIQKYNSQIAKRKELKQLLRKIENQFQVHWNQVKKITVDKISGELEDFKQKSLIIQADEAPLSSQILKNKDTNIMEKLYEEKYLLYTAYLKQNLPKNNIDKAIIEPLLAIITLFSVIHLKIRIKNDKLADIQAKATQEVKNNNSIRARNPSFLNESVYEIMKPVREQMQAQFKQALVKDPQITKLLNNQYLKIFEKYVKFCQNYNQMMEAKKKQQINLYVPEREFTASYPIIFPYQVINSSPYPYLKKDEVETSNTGYHFWKCGFMAMRLKCWSLTCLKTFLYLSWYGRFGLRCFCGIEDFVYDQEIRSGNKQFLYRTTLIGLFKTVLEGISNSRDQFQAQPDEGLFGKKCSRLCNLIQCYIFRFFFVGVIGVLVLYPIAIIFVSTLSLVLAITFWIYVPFALIFLYFFSIFFFELQVGYMRSKISRVFPLIATFVILLIEFIKIIGSVFYLILIAPLVCFFYLLFLLLQRGIRTLTDSLMACLIGCLGRTPRRDTNIATKISGPGMSHNYFMSISEQDVYILTQSALQQILVKKFMQLTKKQLKKCSQKFNSMSNYASRPFGGRSLQYTSYIEQNQIQLTEKFTKKSNIYLSRYPTTPQNVRFTQQELHIYFENSMKIVQNFIQKNKMENWVFLQKNILQGDYDQLTKLIWYQIFNCGEQIFQPLEQIDTRFQLVDEANSNSQIMKKNVRQIVKILQGQVKLSKPTAKIQHHGKISLLSKDQKINEIERICQTHEQNQAYSIKIDINDPTSILIPHRDVQSVKVYDQTMYQEQKKKAMP